MTVQRLLWCVVHVLIVLVLCFLLFRNSLPNDFSFDDHLAIVNNRDVDATSSRALDLWRHDCWGKELDRIDSHRSYRPLLILLFRLIRTRFGLEPRIFRIVSISCHGVASLLVYVLAALLTQDIAMAFAGALLFVAHPVHVEGVVSVVNLAEPLSCSLLTSAFILYWLSTRFELKRPVYRILLISITAPLSFLLIIGALLVKETGVTVTGILVASSGLELIASIARSKKLWPSFRSWLASHGLWVLMSLTILAFYVVLRIAIIALNPVEVAMTEGVLPLMLRTLDAVRSEKVRRSVFLERSELIRRAENPFAALVGQEKMLSLAYLHFRYLALLLWPHPLSAEYSFDCIPKVSLMNDPRNLLSMATYSSTLVALGIGVWRVFFPEVKSEAIRPMISAENFVNLLGWLVISFVPASGVFLKLGTLLAERLLYTPSGDLTHVTIDILFLTLLVAFTILFPLILYHSIEFFVQRFTIKPELLSEVLLWISIFSIVAVYSTLTIRRNTAWQNDAVLFEEAVKACPRSAKMNLMLAKARLGVQDLVGAERLLRNAQEIDPDYCDTKLIEAQLDVYLRGDIDLALGTAADGLTCKYTMDGIWQLMNSLFQLKMSQKPNDPSVLEFIGDTCVRAGVSLIGAKSYQDAVLLYFNQGKLADAIRVSFKVEQRIPHFRLSEEDDSQLPAIHEMTCHIYVLGGSLRSFIRLHGDKAALRMTIRLAEEVIRAKELLFRAADPKCTLVDSRAKVIKYSHSVEAISHLMNLLKLEYKTSPDVAAAYDFLKATDLAITSLLSVKPYQDAKVRSMTENRLHELRFEAGQLSEVLGKHYYDVGNYEMASMTFRKSLEFFKELNACSKASYMLAVSLAQGVTFATNEIELNEAAESLERAAKCSSISKMARMAAASDAANIRRFIKQSRRLSELEIDSLRAI